MKERNKRLIGVSLLIVILQILLLMNTIPAESYIINHINSPESRNTIIKNNSKDFLSSISDLTSFLIGLLSIKQIGLVSAQSDNLTFNCCAKTNGGAICQDIALGTNSLNNSNSCENPLPTKCSETSECKIGTCVFNGGLSCAANSPKQKCEESKGIWKQKATYEIPECTKGACVLGSNIKYVTEKQCELFSKSAGLKNDFRPGVSEFEFQNISKSIQKGACVLPGKNCRFSTISECSSMKGKFYENLLCSNSNLATNCKPTNETTCVKNKVYFVDSCGNPANIYDASKIKEKNYWASVSNQTCNLDLSNSNSIKNCGNCNLFASSQCSKVSNGEVSYGGYACKSLKCVDKNGKVRLNGEKWCVYDGFTGEGKDTVGSEDWIASCDNGKIKLNMCEGHRGQICEQRVIKEASKSFSIASCVTNQGLNCLTDKKNCKDNFQCMVKNINIDKHFKFSACVPRYPQGFNVKDISSSKAICSVADANCTVVYEKGLISGWGCVNNCNCKTSKFTKQMNDLCISLGDCGTYVNYIGDGTNNIQVSGAPDISWKEYKKYANVVKGQYANATKDNQFISPIGNNIKGYKPEEANRVLGEIGPIGVSFGMQVARAYFVTGKVGLENSIANVFSMGALHSFAAASGAAIIGAVAGMLIVKEFKLKGSAASVVSITMGAAFTGVGMAMADQITWMAAGVIGAAALVIIVFVIFSGWGKIKKVKVKFSCLPWQAPSGGNNCQKCNDNPLKPCTEYRCQSLGKACKLINKNTNKPICQSLVEKSKPPVISFGNTETQGYKSQNQETRKVEIRKKNGGCVQEFTPIGFTLKTDEYAQCKWSLQPTANYDAMTEYSAEGTAYTLKHTFGIEGLSLSLLKSSQIKGNLIKGFMGNLNVYVRCKDYFGNFNLNSYVINFCINSAPDITPVDYSYTVMSPANGSVLAYGTKKSNLTMWINEPAECKYSAVKGKNYDEMNNSFNCKTGLTDRELFGWPCSTELTNLQNKNNLYIKCKDQPWKVGNESKLRNTNTEDFAYELDVSKSKLNIDSVYILYNGIKTELNNSASTTINGGGTSFSVELGVETSKGADNGIALCSYESNNRFIPFLHSNSNEHKQKLFLLDGDYDFPIKCVDSVGNNATEDVRFDLKIDNSPPKIIRAYYESGELNLATNEPAKCYVSFNKIIQCGFNIKDAESITPTFSTAHSVKWETGKTYYIKCKDLFDNQNSGCAIKINPSDLAKNF